MTPAHHQLAELAARYTDVTATLQKLELSVLRATASGHHSAIAALEYQRGRFTAILKGIDSMAATHLSENPVEPPPDPVTVIEMSLCEVPYIQLRPGQLYRFVVTPGCRCCENAAAPYLAGQH